MWISQGVFHTNVSVISCAAHHKLLNITSSTNCSHCTRSKLYPQNVVLIIFLTIVNIGLSWLVVEVLPYCAQHINFQQTYLMHNLFWCLPCFFVAPWCDFIIVGKLKRPHFFVLTTLMDIKRSETREIKWIKNVRDAMWKSLYRTPFV